MSQISAHPQSQKFEQAPSFRIFLNSRVIRKTCSYCHLIHNFLASTKVKSVQENSFLFVPVISISMCL